MPDASFLKALLLGLAILGGGYALLGPLGIVFSSLLAGPVIAWAILSGISRAKHKLREWHVGAGRIDIASFCGKDMHVYTFGEPPVPWINLEEFCNATGLKLTKELPLRLGRGCAEKHAEHGWLISPRAIPHCARWMHAQGLTYDADRLQGWFNREVLNSRNPPAARTEELR